MSRPSINERHVGRTYRSVWLGVNQWSVQAAGGSIANGYAQLDANQDIGMLWVPPYDLDPSFAVKFRVFFMSGSAQTVTPAIYCNIAAADGSGVSYEYDRSTSTALTTPVPAKIVGAGMVNKMVATAAGSLTLPSATNRNWNAGLYLVADKTCQYFGVEVGYVPLIAGVIGYPSTIDAPWV